MPHDTEQLIIHFKKYFKLLIYNLTLVGNECFYQIQFCAENSLARVLNSYPLHLYELPCQALSC